MKIFGNAGILPAFLPAIRRTCGQDACAPGHFMLSDSCQLTPTSHRFQFPRDRPHFLRSAIIRFRYNSRALALRDWFNSRNMALWGGWQCRIRSGFWQYL